MLPYGTEVEFIATPQMGYGLPAIWTINGIVDSNEQWAKITRQIDFAPLDVKVEFTLISDFPFPVTFPENVTAYVGGVPITSGTGVARGSIVEFTAHPPTGYDSPVTWLINNQTWSGGVTTQREINGEINISSVTFTEIPIFAAEISPTEHTFTLPQGYLSTMQTFTITNTGNRPITGLRVSRTGNWNAFVSSTLSATSLNPNETATISVGPSLGLVTGNEYSAEMSILTNEELASPLTVTVNVSVYAIAPVLVSSLPNGAVREEYHHNLIESGSTSVISVEGELPTGLIINGHYLTGTPTQAGDFTFTVNAENTEGYAEKDFTVTIAPFILADYIKEAEEIIESGVYELAYVRLEALRTALENAQAVNDKTTPTKEEVSTAIAELRAALDALAEVTFHNIKATSIPSTLTGRPGERVIVTLDIDCDGFPRPISISGNYVGYHMVFYPPLLVRFPINIPHTAIHGDVLDLILTVSGFASETNFLVPQFLNINIPIHVVDYEEIFPVTYGKNITAPIDNGASLLQGEFVAFTATPPQGYTFPATWTVNGLLTSHSRGHSAGFHVGRGIDVSVSFTPVSLAQPVIFGDNIGALVGYNSFGESGSMARKGETVVFYTDCNTPAIWTVNGETRAEITDSITVTVESALNVSAILINDINATITTSSLPDGQVGEEYNSFTLSYYAETLSDTFMWNVTGLPQGLTHSNGVIYGTPAANTAGTHLITITLTNTTRNITDTVTLNLVIRPPAAPVLAVTTAFANPSDEVTVQAHITNNSGFSSMNMRITFPDELTLTDYSFYGSDMTGFYAPNNLSEVSNYALFGWSGLTQNVNRNGELFTLTFKVCLNASEQHYPITVTFENTPKNSNNEDIDISVKNGGIRIQPPIKGDMTGDRRITSADSVILARHLLKHSVSIDLRAADINCDGEINTADLTLLAKVLVGIYSTLCPLGGCDRCS